MAEAILIGVVYFASYGRWYHRVVVCSLVLL